MRVLFDRGGAGTIEGKRAMAVQADLIAGFPQLGVVAVPCTSWQLKQVTPRRLHHALHEIIPLHAIFVGCAVGEMRESGFAELVSSSFQ